MTGYRIALLKVWSVLAFRLRRLADVLLITRMLVMIAAFYVHSPAAFITSLYISVIFFNNIPPTMSHWQHIICVMFLLMSVCYFICHFSIISHKTLDAGFFYSPSKNWRYIYN